MEPTSTQAVTPTSTTVEPTVKRLRRGDVREDGMVFWAYGKSYANGENWLLPEKFSHRESCRKERVRAICETRKEKRKNTVESLRRGDIRGDGKIFWRYGYSFKNGEQWVSPDEYITLETSRKAYEAVLLGRHQKRQNINLGERFYRGYTRADGQVFWGYSKFVSGGEQWLPREQFDLRQARRRRYSRDYGRSHRDSINFRDRERRATDPLYAIKGRIRRRVLSSLKSKGLRKNAKTEAMLGCTYEEFKAHIERLFLPGMSWANFSDCHIDHVIPLDAAKTEEDVYSLSHYTNLRPMWGKDNQSKSSKLPKEHELPANLHPKAKEIWLTAKERLLGEKRCHTKKQS